MKGKVDDDAMRRARVLSALNHIIPSVNPQVVGGGSKPRVTLIWGRDDVRALSIIMRRWRRREGWPT